MSFFLQDAATTNQLLSYLPILVIFGIFYFLLFLPMQRQRRNTQKMLTELQNGDTIVTSGGLIGTIVAINTDDTLTVKMKPGELKLQVLRSAVTGLMNATPKSEK